MKKPICLIYSNCQGDCVAHYLGRTSISDRFEIRLWHNWQVLMGEQDPVAMMAEVKRAEIFIYQPAGKMGEAASTEDICEKHLPASARAVSFSYLYNHGFFPFLQVSSCGQLKGWIASEDLKARVRRGNRHDLFASFNADSINYDCARRFAECLAEQSRRERYMDVKMADFILQNFQEQQLFLTENHPTSAAMVELTLRVMEKIGQPEQLTWKGINETGLNGQMPIHPEVCRELGLKFAAEDGAHNYYRTVLERMLKDK